MRTPPSTNNWYCIGYISEGKVVGLSKINRIVDYYSKRPQVQKHTSNCSRTTKILNTDDVACVIDAKHLCVNLIELEIFKAVL